MNKMLILFTLLSFTAIAVFGIMAMGHNGNSTTACLASVAQRTGCMSTNPFTALNFYLSTFKSFSQTTLVTFLTLALILLILWRPSLLLLAPAKSPEPRLLSYSFQDTQLPTQRVLQRWLARHEMRDPNALA